MSLLIEMVFCLLIFIACRYNPCLYTLHTSTKQYEIGSQENISHFIQEQQKPRPACADEQARLGVRYSLLDL